MSENLIYTDRDQPIDEALATMTDRWIDSSEYCQKTVIDLRDRLREHRDSLTKLVEEWRLNDGDPTMHPEYISGQQTCAGQLQALIK